MLMSFSRHINQSNGRMCSVCARCMNRTTTNPVKCKCASEGTRQQPVSQSVNRMEFMKIKKKRKNDDDRRWATATRRGKETEMKKIRTKKHFNDQKEIETLQNDEKYERKEIKIRVGPE